MGWLALAVGCSLAIGMIFKYTGRRGLDRMGLLTANYAAAVLLALLLRPASSSALEAGFLGLAVATGALFIGGFFVFSLAVEVAGMSLAIGVMRVSVVIPFLASWWIWGEAPTAAQGLGLALAALAFFLIARRPGGGAEAPRAGRTLAVLALLFLAGGTVDLSMKAFDELFADTVSRPLFQLILFGIAFLIGLALVVRTRLGAGRWPERAALGWGIALGMVNYGSVEFFLRAVSVLSGPFVFPANNIAIVLGGALLGVMVWGESLSRLNRIGLALAALALVLLSV